jgi:purine-cytosine permease-like protein
MSASAQSGERPERPERLETLGVAPIPEARRTMTAPRVFIVWAMASASALTPILGKLLFNFGLVWLVVAILGAWLLAFIPAGLFSEMGREIPLTALIVARGTFGQAGAFMFSVLFTVVNIGFFGLNTAVAGGLLAAIAHSSSATPWTWLVGLLQTAAVLVGMRFLEPFYRYTAAVFVVCYGVLVGYLFAHYHPGVPAAHGPLDWGPALTTILSLSILAWTYKLSTVTRFARPKAPGARTTPGWFLAASAGIMLAVLLLGVVGLFSQAGTHNWNVALLGAKLSWIGTIAAIGVVLAIIHTNAMNLYPSTIDMLVAANTLTAPRRWEQPVGTLVLGVLSTLLAVAGILSHISSFVDSIGDALFPFTFVMLVDWIYVQRRATAAESFFAPPRTSADWLSLPAGFAFAIGCAFSIWFGDIAPSWWVHQIPTPFVGALLSAAIYAALAVLRPAATASLLPGSRSAPASDQGNP